MRRLIAAIVIVLVVPYAQAAENECSAALSHEVRKLRSTESLDLCDTFRGKALLVVNTASHCGFTPQFEGLEALYQAYKDEGLAVLGVPSDDFRQAAQDEETAARICYINYGVTFTMLSQQRVRGPDAHPIFRELGRQPGEPTWNFNKYLLDREGNVVERFDSTVEPMSARLRKSVESVL
jgi:glutathione peroxidase